MKFTEHQDINILAVKKYRSGCVKINNEELTQSCYLNQNELHKNWPCFDIKDLNESLFESIFALNPEVIILGTGDEQSFPEPKWFAFCARQGIGLEVMDNAAACRTYNVITTEEREVILALIMQSEV